MNVWSVNSHAAKLGLDITAPTPPWIINNKRKILSVGFCLLSRFTPTKSSQIDQLGFASIALILLTSKVLLWLLLLVANSTQQQVSLIRFRAPSPNSTALPSTSSGSVILFLPKSTLSMQTMLVSRLLLMLSKTHIGNHIC